MEYESVSLMDANEPVSAAVAKIMRGEPCVIVLKNGHYYGIFDELDVREVADPSREKVGNLAERAPVITENMDTLTAVRMFLDGRFKTLPVVTEDGYKVIRRNKLLKYLHKNKMLPKATVGEVMTMPVLTLESNEPVGHAREVMRKNNVRRVVVTENGKIAGVLAMRDIISIAEVPTGRLPFVKEKHRSDTLPIKNYMREEVYMLPPTASVSEAVQLLQDSDASSVVVAEKGRPLGIVSVRDLFEVIATQKSQLPIYFSGMDRRDEEYMPEVRSTIERAVEKLEDIARIEYVAVHYKKQRYTGLRSMYEVKVRAKSDSIVSVSASDWDIRSATQKAARELLAVFKKQAGRARAKTNAWERDRRRE
ncbi:MAG: CBS domain-containing protein [Candidatus Micrarchaeia archaeon]